VDIGVDLLQADSEISAAARPVRLPVVLHRDLVRTPDGRAALVDGMLSRRFESLMIAAVLVERYLVSADGTNPSEAR
jgi:hypothetical protein